MTDVSINFLRQKRKKLTQLQSTDQRYAAILGVVTGLVFIAAGVSYGLDVWLQRQITQSQRQQRQVSQAITSLASQEAEYLVLADKLNALDSLIGQNKQKQEAIEFFTLMFARSQITLNEVNVTSKDVIQFDVSASSVFIYSDLLTTLQSAQVRQVYPQIRTTDISRAKTGEYTSAVIVDLMPIAAKSSASTGRQEREQEN